MKNSNQFLNNTRLDLAKKYPDQSRQDKINLTVSNVNYRSICQFHTSNNLITYLRVHGIFPFIPIPWFLLVATIILIFILILGPKQKQYDGYFIFTIFVFSKQVWRSGPGLKPAIQWVFSKQVWPTEYLHLSRVLVWPFWYTQTLKFTVSVFGKVKFF